MVLQHHHYGTWLFFSMGYRNGNTFIKYVKLACMYDLVVRISNHRSRLFSRSHTLWFISTHAVTYLQYMYTKQCHSVHTQLN